MAQAPLPASLKHLGAAVTVIAIDIVDAIDLNKSNYRPGSPNAKYTKTAAGDGYRYAVVRTRVHNIGPKPMDLTCSLPINTLFVDKRGREFDAIENLYEVKGNPECNVSLQPEDETAMAWVYKIPVSAEPGKWGFVDLENGGFGQTDYVGINL